MAALPFDDSILNWMSLNVGRGVSDDSMTTVQYAIDVEFFQSQVDFWLPQRPMLREKMGIPPEDHVLIYCGKIFPPKNPFLISRAIESLPAELKKNLWLVGYPPA